MTTFVTAYRRLGLPDLKLWFNGWDYVVAESDAGAAAEIALYFGEGTPETARGDVLVDWAVVAPDQTVVIYGLVILSAAPTAAHCVKMLAVEWISHHGRGYLASATTSPAQRIEQ